MPILEVGARSLVGARNRLSIEYDVPANALEITPHPRATLDDGPPVHVLSRDRLQKDRAVRKTGPENIAARGHSESACKRCITDSDAQPGLQDKSPPRVARVHPQKRSARRIAQRPPSAGTHNLYVHLFASEAQVCDVAERGEQLLANGP